jgi:two-component system nitrate/nitrite response regulator NarL
MVGIFVVSETRLYREGLARALADEDRFEIVGAAADLASAIALIARLSPLPDVVLLDHAIPEGAGAVRDLQRASPGLRVLAIAVRELESDVIPWAEAGAAGFLPHEASFDDLVAGLTAVAEGAGLCSPRVAAVLLKRLVAGARRAHAARARCGAPHRGGPVQ